MSEETRSGDSGAKLKRQETTEDILDAALSRGRRTRTSTEDKEAQGQGAAKQKFADIESNPFYRIVFGEGDPEAKKAAIARQLAYDVEDEKADNKARLAAFELFKEWLMEQRKDMAQEIIDQAMQAHGAMGVTKEMPLQLMANKVRAMRVYEGPSEVHRMTIGKRVLDGKWGGIAR